MTRDQWNNLWDAMEPLSEVQRIQIHNTVSLDIRILRDLATPSMTDEQPTQGRTV